MIWGRVLRRRPDLIAPLHPMIGWLFPDPAAPGGDGGLDGLGDPVRAVALAAVRAGQLELTGTERRFEVDLLGIVLPLPRPGNALGSCGQYYTPAPVSELTAATVGVREYSRIHDPAMGTGGMFRAVAHRLRAQGLDPRTVAWSGGDIDEIAVACAAANSLLWGLGPDTLFYQGDALGDDHYKRVRARRRACLGVAE
jgi:hypothetical protein